MSRAANWSISAFVAVVLVFVPVTAAQETETHRFTEVAEGVYFVTGTGAMFLQSNCMVVVNDEDVLVVDSHITPAGARALIASIERITEKPITTLVNTHFHYDHAHGNQAFGADVEIIGHEFTYEKLAGKPLEEATFVRSKAGFENRLADLRSRLEEAEDETERAELEGRERFVAAHVEATKEIDPVPPTVTLNKRLTLYRGSREIQLHFFGRAHTGGDVVVYLPQEKVVFTGDMLLGGISWLGDGHVDEWSATLEGLKQLDFEVVLPGHGPLFRDRERIDLVQAYYDDLWQEISELHSGGASAEDAAARADLTRHAETLRVREVGTDLLAVLRIYELLDERTN